MAQRYKINGLVNIPTPLMGSEDFVMDSPEFEITQGRQSNNTAYIGVTYYYNQGELDRTVFVEYPDLFSNLNESAMDAIIELITQADINVLGMPQHSGSVAI